MAVRPSQVPPLTLPLTRAPVVFPGAAFVESIREGSGGDSDSTPLLPLDEIPWAVSQEVWDEGRSVVVISTRFSASSLDEEGEEELCVRGVSLHPPAQRELWKITQGPTTFSSVESMWRVCRKVQSAFRRYPCLCGASPEGAVYILRGKSTLNVRYLGAECCANLFRLVGAYEARA